MTKEERLFRALLDIDTEEDFKEYEKKRKHEYYCLTVRGYDSLSTLINFIPKEHLKICSPYIEDVKKALIKNDNKEKLMEQYAKRVLKNIYLQMPDIVIQCEYRKFFEKIVELYGFELYEEDKKIESDKDEDEDENDEVEIEIK